LSEIGKIVGLRCPNCGASLPETTKELVKCPYCGTTTRIEDASKYLQHLQGFVVNWIRTALPLGIGAYSASVDPIARHNIFVQNVYPNLNAEFGGLQLDAYEAFCSPLIIPPFVKHHFSLGSQRDPKSLFSYDAKISSVQPLAVNQEDQTTLEGMGGLSRAFAHVIIGTGLMENNQAGPYKTAAENFATAAKSLANRNEILSNRLSAISELYLAIDETLQTKTAASRTKATTAKATLENVLTKSTSDINLSICTSGIEQEIEVANTVLMMNDIIENDFTGDPLKSISKIENIFSTTSTFSRAQTQTWRQRFENLGRYSELAKWFFTILQAKKGKGTIKTTPGYGNTLFPFWIAEINYTFGTGTLWMRQGRSVKEIALATATFPLTQNFAQSPSEVVTDIFSRRPDGTFVASIMAPIMGTETSISVGENISRLARNTTAKSASSYNIIPPLSTVSEAKQLMNEYLQHVSNSLQGKLQIASCEVSDLIFIPADLSTGFVNFQDTLSYIQPRKMGDLGVLNSIAV
jgi:hypothetical protein